MEDHKLMNASFGMAKLISLEIDADVLNRQKFNLPLSCIVPTAYSTEDFVSQKAAILKEANIKADHNSVVWFDMTDAMTLRACLDTFEGLLRASEPDDVVRITVDVDEKTLARVSKEVSFEETTAIRFNMLREMLDDQLRPGAKPSDLAEKLGVARLVVYAFQMAAEAAFSANSQFVFEPLSITTYADGHRMLSVTGAIMERNKVLQCRSQMGLNSVPGGVKNWDDLVDVEIPQLTIWEKLTLDREIHAKSSEELAAMIDFKLHESIPTTVLIDGFRQFQRFYPTFRHVLL
jgi:hypothetical protein